ncbi:hypothetical protein C7S18_18885 [Ahniella affigens]|uniref:Lipoprotein SmpA/OmlA domain-containing protein n=1 Tax=Ahniella affigens TaxID=2021234 RepID=A0A2P1PW84_9GAMM|nr:hypothetical protein [Ahniella affigens]AVP99107.1 hypothetical protein C7S18_18885 [Ahniella affigens]
MRLRLMVLFILVLLSSGCVSYRDGPFVRIDGPALDAEQAQDLANRRVSVSELTSTLGDPEHVDRNDSGEVWRYVTTSRRVGTKERLFVERRTCQFVRTGYLFQVVDGAVVGVDTTQSAWITHGHSDPSCAKGT